MFTVYDIKSAIAHLLSNVLHKKSEFSSHNVEQIVITLVSNIRTITKQLFELIFETKIDINAALDLNVLI